MFALPTWFKLVQVHYNTKYVDSVTENILEQDDSFIRIYFGSQ